MKRWWVVPCLFFSLNHSVWSDATWAFSDCRGISGNWYVGTSLGASFPQVENAIYMHSGTGWPDDAYLRHSVDTVPFISLDGGYTWATFNNWFPFYSLGIAYTYVFSSKVHGNIEQYSLPAFNNYTYQYQIQRQTLFATGKVDIYHFEQVMPYVTAGLGVSINRATNYSETALANVTPRTSPGFGEATSTYPSYTVGLGLDFVLEDNLWASLEYDYGYFGYARTSYGTASYSSAKLKNRLTANAVSINLNYFFNF